METSSELPHHTHPPADTGVDYGFLIFMVFIVVAVTWLGFTNFTEARKTEVAKSNGEAWVEWLTEQGTKRFEADYKIEACKGGVKPSADAAKSDTPVLGTWGACLGYIMKNTDLKDQTNTFFNKTPNLIEKCIPTDLSTAGAIVIEDLMPTPPGSAMQMGLAFAGLVVVGAMAMVMYELFSYIEKNTTAWAHRSSQN